jgi:hypothetical protein
MLVAAGLFAAASPALAQDEDCATRAANTVSNIEGAGPGGRRLWNSALTTGRFAECPGAVADRLHDFRERAAADLAGRPQDRYNLTWHEARFAARADQYERAADLFRALLAEDDRARGDQPRSFVEAQIAFVTRDSAALQAARTQLAADIARPPFTSSRGGAFIGGALLTSVDGLVACFNRPYQEADSSTCRP